MIMLRHKHLVDVMRSQHFTSELQVMVSYRDLEQMLMSSHKVKKLEGQVKRLSEQVVALRGQLLETMELIKERK